MRRYKTSLVGPSYVLVIFLSFQFPVKKRRKLDAAEAAALAQANGNKQDAATLLGVSRSNMYRFFDQQEKFPKACP